MGKEHWIKTVEWWFVICGTCPVARSRAVAFISVSPNFIRTLIMQSIKILYLIGLLLQWIVDQKVSKKCHFTWISRSWLAGGSLESSRVPHCWTEPSVINRTWLVMWWWSACLINGLTVFSSDDQKQCARFFSLNLKGQQQCICQKRDECGGQNIFKPHDLHPPLWRTHEGRSTPDDKIKIARYSGHFFNSW